MSTIPSKQEMYQALCDRIGAEKQHKLERAVVAIAGLGGLGSNIAYMLARAGVGHLILVDFDKVDITNLNRQQYKANQIGLFKTDALSANLKEIAPYISLTAHATKLDESSTKELLKDADIICEAFDNAEAKAMLAESVLTQMKDKYLVAASGMAGLGSANDITTRRLSEKFILCGDGISDVNDGIGLVSSRVTLCAAHQAHAVIRIILGMKEV